MTAEILTLPTSEPNKSFDLVFKIAEQLDAFGLNRCASSTLHDYDTSLCWWSCATFALALLLPM